MQLFLSALCGADRPCAPSDCPQCRGCQLLHRHGHYRRYANCTDATKVRVHRFLCPRCGATFSLIPEDKLPYRLLPVSRLEAGLDARVGLPERPASTGEGARPPPVSEVERGCLERAGKSLLLRIPVLRGWLGQRLPVLADDDFPGFWIALRKVHRSIAQTLRFLAECFKSSLLAHYRSLRPPWAREKVPT
jgi:hypothetical protein